MHEVVRMSVAARRMAVRFAEGVSAGVKNLFIVLYAKSFRPMGSGLDRRKSTTVPQLDKRKGLDCSDQPSPCQYGQLC